MSSSSSHSLVEAATERTSGYVSRIEERVQSTVTSTSLELPADVIEVKHEGKVRDVYRCKDFIVMVATDR